MNKPAAISASLVDVRNVAAHKCVKLEIHVPAEQAPLVMEAFGWPTMVDPVPVAIARIDPSKNVARLEDHRQKRKWDDLKLAAQAGIRCGEPAFQRYLAENHLGECPDEKTAVAFVHQYCGIHSRAGLNDNPKAAAKWVQLDSLFQLWMRDVG